MDLLQLGESQRNKYTTLTNVTSPRARGSSPGSHHGSMSPRLVHQIVSHNQWVAGERPVSPKQSPGNPKQSCESDSNDSANDGSGKDKRAGIREVHNKLEKNRRAHLKECFENLRKAVPNMEDKKAKTSNLSILRGALRFIQVLTRKERELEHELDRLVRQKIEAQQRLDLLKIKNGLTIGKPLKLPTAREVEEMEEDDDEEERLVVVEDKDVEVTVDDEKKNEVDDDQASTSTASEAEEEERKSRAQSRSQSPLHQPVSSSHLPFPLPGVSSSYQQAFASFQGTMKEKLPYPNPTSRPIGLSRSANEAMLRLTTMRDVQSPPGSDPSRPKQKHPEAMLSRHGSAPSLGTSTIPPQRTTYMQMSQAKSTVLHSVASQISPATIGASPSTGALAGSVTRQTVSQLLGKQPVVRQPVRRQLSSQLPVIQSPLQTSHQLLPRIMSTPSLRLGFNPSTQGVMGPNKPVVTVGINSLLAQPSVIQTTSTHKTIISSGPGTTVPNPSTVTFTAKSSVITASPLTTSAVTSPLTSSVLSTTIAGAPNTSSLMTASVITQTLPVMSHTGHSQLIPPIALQSPANPGASFLFTHPSNYIGLPHSMLPQPFLGSFAATRPSPIQLATSTQVSPSLATTQPLVHPSTQSLDSANLLALAQALPKQMPPAQYPSALSIGNLASSGALLSTNLPGVKHGPFTTVASTAVTAAQNTVSASHASKRSKSSGGKGSRSKHGKNLNGKTEIQITTSKIAETMATLTSNTQVIAKNGHSASTVANRTSQQSVVVKL
ncbi:max-binding protein MNT-like [Lytechinus pictus]|uniref:max-binding protein MNT-like n=1 Tax=Lytechinus pictus TaxID=7653 RepID=UPI0030BA1949